MFHFKRTLLFSFTCLFLAAGLALAPFGAGRTQNRSDSQSSAPQSRHVRAIDDDGDVADQEDENAKLRNDPCDRLIDNPGDPVDNPGEAKGIDRRCAHGGGSSGIARGDFNGDGFGDLAVGVPSEDTDGKADAGAVNIIYGSTNGLVATGANVVIAAQLWSQETAGVPGTAQAGDKFGSALASGDFNGDGCSDLAIGVPGEDYVAWVGHPIQLLNVVDAGAVNVIYGSDAGIIASGASTARCGTHAGVPGPRVFEFTDVDVTFSTAVDPEYAFQPGNGDKFGSALAWGDFDHDGKGDLAIGVPYWDVQQDSMLCRSTIANAGAVAIFEGGNEGLQTGGDLWSQHGLALMATDDESAGLFCSNGDGDLVRDFYFTWSPVSDVAANFDILGGPETYDHFGSTLAAGDFNGDNFSDLAIGVPEEDISDVSNAGAVNVLFGGGSGLSNERNQFWSQGEGGIKDTLQSDDGFGKAMAAGDFNGDGKADLAVGVPQEDVGTLADAGSINIIYGSEGGLTDVGDQYFDESNLFAFSEAQTLAKFGFSLAAGDFNGDGARDLAIGAPFHDVVKNNTRRPSAGHVVIIYGRVGVGLDPDSRKIVAQGLDFSILPLTGTILGEPEKNDYFGWSLTAWNFGRSAQADLAIGIPFEDLAASDDETVNTIVDAGQVYVMYGGTNGLFTTGQQRWKQANPNLQGGIGAPGVPGGLNAGDGFGLALY